MRNSINKRQTCSTFSCLIKTQKTSKQLKTICRRAWGWRVALLNSKNKKIVSILNKNRHKWLRGFSKNCDRNR